MIKRLQYQLYEKSDDFRQRLDYYLSKWTILLLYYFGHNRVLKIENLTFIKYDDQNGAEKLCLYFFTGMNYPIFQLKFASDFYIRTQKIVNPLFPILRSHSTEKFCKLCTLANINIQNNVFVANRKSLRAQFYLAQIRVRCLIYNVT